ncbi:ABC transporter permease [Clostridium sp. 1001271B_151109_B4]|uniref:ABC transporter permease n=1 Tax=Clostridium sp. 1001271B_151109_B4 TaxID=2787148 RepID=UPI0018AA000F|nr:ABC transporter permease [Clostridium sp. 1001271B_151109_B4]
MLNSPSVNLEKKRIQIFSNGRRRIVFYITISVIYLLTIFIVGLTMNPDKYAVDYSAKFISPSLGHLFGTDFMGRDMFWRCIKGLSNSILIGIFASVVSSFIALLFGVSSAIIGGWYDRFINWCVDLCMGIPHLILLILISFMLGRGAIGVTVAVALTHWTGLTRLVRAEVLQVRSTQYVQAAYKMGKSKFQVAISHIIPQVLPVYLIGVVLLFPHAIMHEASITFLGFGIPAEVPAIGVILSEAMKHIATGKWWLALFPGLMLLSVVLLFDVIGENLKQLINPNSGNE